MNRKCKISSAYYRVESPCPQVYAVMVKNHKPKKVEKKSFFIRLLKRLVGENDIKEPPDTLIYIFIDKQGVSWLIPRNVFYYKEGIMRRLENTELEMRGLYLYEFDDGDRIQLSIEAVTRYGAVEVVNQLGYGGKLSDKRLPVYQAGVNVGYLPANFDPMVCETNNTLYTVRRGDFLRYEDHWKACPSLGKGDFRSIPEFSEFIY